MQVIATASVMPWNLSTKKGKPCQSRGAKGYYTKSSCIDRCLYRGK